MTPWALLGPGFIMASKAFIFSLLGTILIAGTVGIILAVFGVDLTTIYKIDLAIFLILNIPTIPPLVEMLPIPFTNLDGWQAVRAVLGRSVKYAYTGLGPADVSMYERSLILADSCVDFFIHRGAHFNRDSDVLHDVATHIWEASQTIGHEDEHALWLAGAKVLRDYLGEKGRKNTAHLTIYKGEAESPTTDTFGDRLLRLREYKGIKTAAELERRMFGEIRDLVSHWEDNSRLPSPENMKILSETLNADVGFLLTGIPEEDIMRVTVADEDSLDYRLMFAMKMRVLRYKKGLTLSKIAEEIGVKLSTVSKWESGEQLPEPDNMAELIKILEADIGLLLFGTKEEDIMATRSDNKSNQLHKDMMGKKIKMLRYKIGLFASEVSLMIDKKNPGLVSGWEVGRNMPNDRRMRKLADILGTTVSILLTGLTEEDLLDIPTKNRKSKADKDVLGLKIKVLRYKDMLHIKELASLAGVSWGVVRDAESGKKFPMDENLTKVARIQGKSLNELLGMGTRKQITSEALFERRKRTYEDSRGESLKTAVTLSFRNTPLNFAFSLFHEWGHIIMYIILNPISSFFGNNRIHWKEVWRDIREGKFTLPRSETGLRGALIALAGPLWTLALAAIFTYLGYVNIHEILYGTPQILTFIYSISTSILAVGMLYDTLRNTVISLILYVFGRKKEEVSDILKTWNTLIFGEAVTEVYTRSSGIPRVVWLGTANPLQTSVVERILSRPDMQTLLRRISDRGITLYAAFSGRIIGVIHVDDFARAQAREALGVEIPEGNCDLLNLPDDFADWPEPRQIWLLRHELYHSIHPNDQTQTQLEMHIQADREIQNPDLRRIIHILISYLSDVDLFRQMLTTGGIDLEDAMGDIRRRTDSLRLNVSLGMDRLNSLISYSTYYMIVMTLRSTGREEEARQVEAIINDIFVNTARLSQNELEIGRRMAEEILGNIPEGRIHPAFRVINNAVNNLIASYSALIAGPSEEPPKLPVASRPAELSEVDTALETSQSLIAQRPDLVRPALDLYRREVGGEITDGDLPRVIQHTMDHFGIRDALNAMHAGQPTGGIMFSPQLVLLYLRLVNRFGEEGLLSFREFVELSLRYQRGSYVDFVDDISDFVGGLSPDMNPQDFSNELRRRIRDNIPLVSFGGDTLEGAMHKKEETKKVERFDALGRLWKRWGKTPERRHQRRAWLEGERGKTTGYERHRLRQTLYAVGFTQNEVDNVMSRISLVTPPVSPSNKTRTSSVEAAIIREMGELHILFPRERIAALDFANLESPEALETLGYLLHELTEAELMDSGMPEPEADYQAERVRGAWVDSGPIEVYGLRRDLASFHRLGMIETDFNNIARNQLGVTDERIRETISRYRENGEDAFFPALCEPFIDELLRRGWKISPESRALYRRMLERYMCGEQVARFEDRFGHFDTKDLVMMLQKLHTLAMAMPHYNIREEALPVINLDSLVLRVPASNAERLRILRATGIAGPGWQYVVPDENVMQSLKRWKENMERWQEAKRVQNDEEANAMLRQAQEAMRGVRRRFDQLRTGDDPLLRREVKAICEFFGIDIAEMEGNAISQFIRDMNRDIDEDTPDAGKRYVFVERLPTAKIKELAQKVMRHLTSDGLFLFINACAARQLTDRGIAVDSFVGRGFDALSMRGTYNGRRVIIKIHFVDHPWVNPRFRRTNEEFMGMLEHLKERTSRNPHIPLIIEVFPANLRGKHVNVVAVVGEVEGEELSDMVDTRAAPLTQVLRQTLGVMDTVASMVRDASCIDLDAVTVHNYMVENENRSAVLVDLGHVWRIEELIAKEKAAGKTLTPEGMRDYYRKMVILLTIRMLTGQTWFNLDQEKLNISLEIFTKRYGSEYRGAIFSVLRDAWLDKEMDIETMIRRLHKVYAHLAKEEGAEDIALVGAMHKTTKLAPRSHCVEVVPGLNRTKEEGRASIEKGLGDIGYSSEPDRRSLAGTLSNLEHNLFETIAFRHAGLKRQLDLMKRDFKTFILDRVKEGKRRVIFNFIGVGYEQNEMKITLEEFYNTLESLGEDIGEWEVIVYASELNPSYIPTREDEAEGHGFTKALATLEVRGRRVETASLRLRVFPVHVNLFDTDGMEEIHAHCMANFGESANYILVRHLLYIAGFYRSHLPDKLGALDEGEPRNHNAYDAKVHLALGNLLALSAPGTRIIMEPVSGLSELESDYPEEPMLCMPGTVVRAGFWGASMYWVDNPSEFPSKLMEYRAALVHAYETSRGEVVYGVALDAITGVVDIIRKGAPTYSLAPAFYEHISPTTNCARDVEEIFGDERDVVHSEHYGIGNGENWFENLLERLDPMLEEFNDVVASGRPAPRMLIRALGGREEWQRIRDHIERRLEELNTDADGKVDKEAVRKALRMIHVITVSVEKAKYLNPVIDLFTDITAMEFDRYRQKDYVMKDADDNERYQELKSILVRLLRISTVNLTDLTEDNLLSILQDIFNGLKALVIRAINWESIRMWKKKNDALAASV